MKLRSLVATALAAVAIVVGIAMLPAAPASAHANYESSSPTRGEQLAIAPTQVEITFTQEIQKIAGSYDITVNKDRGLSVTSGPAVVNDADRTKMSVPLQSNLDDGRYVVNWSNVSDADGDPKVGAFSFYINHVPTAVDLANDAALEQVGAEEETPATGESPAATAPAAETAAPTPPENTVTGEPTSSETPTENPSDDDGGSNSTVFIVVGIVIVSAVAVGGVAFVRSRSR